MDSHSERNLSGMPVFRPVRLVDNHHRSRDNVYIMSLTETAHSNVELLWYVLHESSFHSVDTVQERLHDYQFQKDLFGVRNILQIP